MDKEKFYNSIIEQDGKCDGLIDLCNRCEFNMDLEDIDCNLKRNIRISKKKLRKIQKEKLKILKEILK